LSNLIVSSYFFHRETSLRSHRVRLGSSSKSLTIRSTFLQPRLGATKEATSKSEQMRQAHPRDRKSSSRRGVLARGQLTLRERTTDRQPEGSSASHPRQPAGEREREREREREKEREGERERYMPGYHTCNDPVNLNLCSALARLIAARCKSFAEMSLSSAKGKGPACDLRPSRATEEEHGVRARARARTRSAREGSARSFAEGDKWRTRG